MKYIFTLFIILSSQGLFAKSILLSGFDALNNSEIIAQAVQKKFKGSDIKVHYCQLRTVYYKSAQTLQDCFHALGEKPDFVISLGEGHCDKVGFETRAINLMKSELADNDGIKYWKEKINPDGPKRVTLSLDLSRILPMLSKKDRKLARMSKNAGRFVCNNLAYIMGTEFTEAPFTFIHVPNHDCSNQEYQKKRTIEVLTKTIKALF